MPPTKAVWPKPLLISARNDIPSGSHARTVESTEAHVLQLCSQKPPQYCHQCAQLRCHRRHTTESRRTLGARRSACRSPFRLSRSPRQGRLRREHLASVLLARRPICAYLAGVVRWMAREICRHVVLQFRSCLGRAKFPQAWMRTKR